MPTTGILLTEAWRSFRKVLPGLTVLIVVFVLLRGVTGTVDAVKLQLVTFLASFMGSGDGLAGVLVHTLPLAIAAAVATFAVKSRMLTFESPWSCVGLACIIIAGTSVGGLLRGFVPDPPSKGDSNNGHSAASLDDLAGQSTRTPLIGVRRDAEYSNSLVRPQAALLPGPMETDSILSVRTRSPLDQLGSIDWLAQPDLAKAAPRNIEPLNVLPTTGGVPGLVMKAINLVLGFLVAYQPRLFLAAVIAGGWIGWTVHHRMTSIHERVVEMSVSPGVDVEIRRAA